MQCENMHEKLEIIYYSKILPNIEKIKSEMEELRKKINIFNEHILDIINKLNKVKDIIEIYSKINYLKLEYIYLEFKNCKDF